MKSGSPTIGHRLTWLLCGGGMKFFGWMHVHHLDRHPGYEQALDSHYFSAH